MARKPTLSPSEQMEMRLMRESGVSVIEAAKYAGVSRTTALRTLAKLRKKLGPEKLRNRQSARAHLYVNSATSQNLTPNTSDT